MSQFNLADVSKVLRIIIRVCSAPRKAAKRSIPDAQLWKQNDRVLLVRSLLNDRMFGSPQLAEERSLGKITGNVRFPLISGKTEVSGSGRDLTGLVELAATTERARCSLNLRLSTAAD